MGKQKGHGRKFQPAVNIGEPGTVQQAYSWLFPKDAQKVVQRVRRFDTDWFQTHPGVKAFYRRYVPGEGYPKHDPTARYVAVFREGINRARAFTVEPSPELPYVEIDVDDYQSV